MGRLRKALNRNCTPRLIAVDMDFQTAPALKTAKTEPTFAQFKYLVYDHDLLTDYMMHPHVRLDIHHPSCIVKQNA